MARRISMSLEMPQILVMRDTAGEKTVGESPRLSSTSRMSLVRFL